MNEPTVCAVMLTANRPEMARRAVECFRSQTYGPKRIHIFDTSSTSKTCGAIDDRDNETHFWVNDPAYEAETFFAGMTVGCLRNEAIEDSKHGHTGADIIIHFDDDDWSHPNRIAEQVALLQSSGADAVGYNEMLFWREPQYTERNYRQEVTGEAWLYSSPSPRYILGTSFCYWRHTWEKRPFEATDARTGNGEDTIWLQGVKSVGVSSRPIDEDPPMSTREQPRMIASIHGANTSNGYSALAMSCAQWKRAYVWDAHCRSTMEAR